MTYVCNVASKSRQHDGGDEQPLLTPVLDFQRADSEKAVPKRRTVTDIMEMQADGGSPGLEDDGLPVLVWPQALFQKRKGKQK